MFLGTGVDNQQDMIAKGRKVVADISKEKNGRAKLTEQLVEELRFRYKHEKISAKNLGLCYGISESQTLRIIKHESWSS